MTHLFIWTSAGVACLMVFVWILSLIRRDVSIVDLFWGPGFVLVAWITFAITNAITNTSESSELRQWLLTILPTIWGLRLCVYLTWRNWGEPEDKRYQKMREKRGAAFPLVSLVTVFLLQGVVMWIVSLPIQVGQLPADSEPILWLIPIGILVWLTGLFFETVGDLQLARFKNNPEDKGQVMDRGLWRYTRHPNYFGDFLVWWGFYLVALSNIDAWWTLIGPLVMSVFLMRVSGVTLLEKDLKANRPGYEEYIRRTNAFFPGPPKGQASEG